MSAPNASPLPAPGARAPGSGGNAKSVPADPALEIEFLSAAAAPDAGLVATVTGLINSVYSTSENGLWIEGTLRTSEAEVAALIRSGELATATSGDVIVGTVRAHRLDPMTGEFGMLAAHPDRRGLGIGRGLVAFAEDWARRCGLASMQLEVLTPSAWTHPSKVFLMQWYERIGYRHIRTGSLDTGYPALAPLLATPCDFAVYRKDLCA